MIATNADPEEFNSGRKIISVEPDSKDNLRNASTE